MKSAIFNGRVRHLRRTPAKHAFNYPVYMMYLDLAEIDQVFEKRLFWSAHRPAMARFKRGNYLGETSTSLDQAVRDLVKNEKGARPVGPIRILTNLSCFGFCFNPISLYYCFDKHDNALEYVVAEVSNTPWGERHCYVLENHKKPEVDEKFTAECSKELHVSPFMDMHLDYEWLLTPPTENLVVRIQNKVAQEAFFTATLVLQRTEISTTSLASTLLRFPLMTFRIVLAIHWQALRLFFKRCPIYLHPKKRHGLRASQ